MRLFIAVNFDDETRSRFLDIQKSLRAQSVRGNFTRPLNLHLTLAFIGETSGEKLNDLYTIMEKINSPPFEISFSHAGCFTHSRKELWWIGVKPGSPGLPALGAVHGEIVKLLSEAGFPVDKRPYSAHITLGREIKSSSPIVLDCPEIAVKVNRLSLMKSEHIKGVLTYTEIKEKRL